MQPLTNKELTYIKKVTEESENAGFTSQQVTKLEWGMPDHVDLDACHKTLIDDKYVVTISSRTKDWRGTVDWVNATSDNIPDSWERIMYITAERAAERADVCTPKS